MDCELLDESLCWLDELEKQIPEVRRNSIKNLLYYRTFSYYEGRYYWWLVRVTLVVDCLFLPQNFRPVSPSLSCSPSRDRERYEPPGETFTTRYFSDLSNLLFTADEGEGTLTPSPDWTRPS